MRLLSVIEKYEKLDEKKREMFVEIIHGQARYIFGDCTIKFTSPYRLEAPPIGRKASKSKGKPRKSLRKFYEHWCYGEGREI